jgi:hypothetical protein
MGGEKRPIFSSTHDAGVNDVCWYKTFSLAHLFVNAFPVISDPLRRLQDAALKIEMNEPASYPTSASLWKGGSGAGS